MSTVCEEPIDDAKAKADEADQLAADLEAIRRYTMVSTVCEEPIDGGANATNQHLTLNPPKPSKWAWLGELIGRLLYQGPR